MHTYATTKELKKKAFTIKIRNIKEAINIQVTLISEVKHQIKIRPFFFGRLCGHFETLLGLESAHACHNLKTEKEDI